MKTRIHDTKLDPSCFVCFFQVAPINDQDAYKSIRIDKPGMDELKT